MNKYFVSYAFRKGNDSGFGSMEIENYWKMSDDNFVSVLRGAIAEHNSLKEEAVVILNIIQLK